MRKSTITPNRTPAPPTFKPARDPHPVLARALKTLATPAVDREFMPPEQRARMAMLEAKAAIAVRRANRLTGAR